MSDGMIAQEGRRWRGNGSVEECLPKRGGSGGVEECLPKRGGFGGVGECLARQVEEWWSACQREVSVEEWLPKVCGASGSGCGNADTSQTGTKGCQLH
jgi:hypothetical protein